MIRHLQQTVVAFAGLVIMPASAFSAPCPTGRVADDLGKPIPAVELYIDGAAAGRSGPDGGLAPACAGAGATLRVEAEDYEPVELAWTGGEIRLKPDHALRGRVTTEAAGATVSLFLDEALTEFWAGEELPPPAAKAITAVSGRFRFPGQPVGRYRLLLEAAGRQAWLSGPLDYLTAQWRGRDFAMKASTTITGRVSADGKPLPGAKLRLGLPAGAMIAAMEKPGEGLPGLALRETTVESDAGGRFIIEGLDPGQGYAVIAQAAGRAPAMRYNLAAGAPVEIALGAGTTVSGHLRSKDGKALSDAKVRAELSYDGMRWVFPGAPFPALSATLFPADADGIPYRIAGVNERAMALTATATSCKPSTHQESAAPEQENANHDFVLEPGWSLRGTVTGGNGKPLKSGIVIPLKPGARRFELAGARAVVRDGEFILADLQQPRVDLQFVAPGHAMRKVDGADAGPGGRPLRIALLPAATISGRVVDEAGRPVSRFTVETEGDFFSPPSAIVREDGGFSIRSRHGETTAVKVSVAGMPPIVADGLSVKGGERRDLGTLVAKRGGATLRGEIRDEAGRAVADAEIEAYETGNYRDSSKVNSDAAGQFEFPGLKPGRYRLSGRHPEFMEARSETEVPADGAGAGPVKLTLKRGAALTLEVQDEQGLPSRGEMIMVIGNRKPMTEESPGRYSAGGIAEKQQVILFLSPPAFSRVIAIPEGREAVRIRRGKGSLRGVVNRGSRPAAGEAVSLHIRYFMDDFAFDEFMGKEEQGRGATCDEAGRFAFDDVPAGDYLLKIGSFKKKLTIPDRGMAEEAVTLNANRLRGCVKSQATGAPLPGAKVRLSSRLKGVESRRGESGADGCYQFDGVAEGDATLVVTAQSVEVSREVKLAAGENQAPTIELATGAGEIAGTITDAAGALIRGWCSISFGTADQGAATRATVNEGKFSLTGLPAGAYRLAAYCSGRAKASLAVELREPDQMKRTAEFRMRPESRLRVRLKKADGSFSRAFFAHAVATGGCGREGGLGFVPDESDTAVIEGLSACAYEVSSSDWEDNRNSDPVSVSLAEGEVRELVLTETAPVPDR